VIVAHVAGVPVEETVLQLAPAGAVMLSAVWVSARHALRRLRSSSRRSPQTKGRGNL
jgi:hypothetical protein